MGERIATDAEIAALLLDIGEEKNTIAKTYRSLIARIKAAEVVIDAYRKAYRGDGSGGNE